MVFCTLTKGNNTVFHSMIMAEWNKLCMRAMTDHHNSLPESPTCCDKLPKPFLRLLVIASILSLKISYILMTHYIHVLHMYTCNFLFYKSFDEVHKVYPVDGT
jgi:hypothetical protein